MSWKKSTQQTSNIAVFLSSNLQSGGGYQYEYMVADIISKHHDDNKIKFKYYSLNKISVNDYKDLDIKIKIIRENIYFRLHRYGILNSFLYKIFCKIGIRFSYIERQLLKDEIDLVYFLSPSSISLSLSDIPYVFTLWDLGHLDATWFPEVSHNRIFEVREDLYSRSLKKAFKVVTDSEYGKKSAIKKYNLDEKRVKVLKFLPNIKDYSSLKTINIKEKYNLHNDYIFYPAQFWPHKNHIYILKAIKTLKEKNTKIDVIFSGSNKGNLDYIMDKAEEYNIQDLIHYVGFVSNEEVPSLYRQSLSLVMPTYLGPTNIPPLEAFSYKTPVCYSDTPFFREQVGDAVFFMDLKDSNSLVSILQQIKSGNATVQNKVIKGTDILNKWNDKDFYVTLIDIFNEYIYIRELWR